MRPLLTQQSHRRIPVRRAKAGCHSRSTSLLAGAVASCLYAVGVVGRNRQRVVYPAAQLGIRVSRALGQAIRFVVEHVVCVVVSIAIVKERLAVVTAALAEALPDALVLADLSRRCRTAFAARAADFFVAAADAAAATYDFFATGAAVSGAADAAAANFVRNAAGATAANFRHAARTTGHGSAASASAGRNLAARATGRALSARGNRSTAVTALDGSARRRAAFAAGGSSAALAASGSTSFAAGGCATFAAGLVIAAVIVAAARQNGRRKNYAQSSQPQKFRKSRHGRHGSASQGGCQLIFCPVPEPGLNQLKLLRITHGMLLVAHQQRHASGLRLGRALVPSCLVGLLRNDRVIGRKWGRVV
jgi:hypothetical protein